MAVVRERIILRKGRRSGEKMPHRIDIKELAEGDSLLVEIVIDKKNDSVYRCLFKPEQLAGRRSVTFRVSGEQVYWLSGLQPKKRGGKAGPRERKVLVFDEEGKLEAVMRSLNDVASMTNLREKAIDKLCKTKRVSTETGYSFRYWWKVLGFDITDFTLTASQYDELCKRKSN